MAIVSSPSISHSFSSHLHLFSFHPASSRLPSLPQRKCVTVALKASKVVQCPPADYDFRADVLDDTLKTIGSQYPELMDLVENGTLLVVNRPSKYEERRSDGYREPEAVFLVGTAHMSVASASQVDRVVRAVRPENVVVELCRSRAGIMYESSAEESRGSKAVNVMSLSGESMGAAMSRSLRLGGRSALALRLMLAGMSRRISKSAGVDSGVEFRAAREAADEIGAQLVLGDRPIEVTLKRAWEALGWNERYRLATMFLQAIVSPQLDVSQETLQRLTSDDVVSQMFAEMGARLPSLLQPLVYERDMYLAWSLKRSKAVNGTSRVVGVVGRGHMRGIVYNLRNDQGNLRFKDLVGDRKSREEDGKMNSVVKNLLLETLGEVSFG